MADLIVLTVPEDISVRARQIAEETAEPVEQVILNHLKSLSPRLPTLAPDMRAELDALQHLSDDALWTIAREQMPDEAQERAHELLEKKSHRELGDAENQELDSLIERADRVMLRKAEAAAILRSRGYIFTPQDFSEQHE
jgi:hypothetical protein